MTNQLRHFGCCVTIATLSLLFAGRTTMAQDPVKLSPDSYKVVLENDSVRVINVSVKVGEKAAMHAHPDYAAYVTSGGKVKFTYPDGKSKEVELKAGETTWSKAETHATENVGKTDAKLVIFELKKSAPASPKAKTPASDDQMHVAPESTKVLLDNERVRLLDVHLKAGGKLAKHSHPAYVGYAVSDSKIKVTGPDGKTEEKAMTAGQAMGHEATTHTVENAGAAEIHSLVLEMKD